MKSLKTPQFGKDLLEIFSPETPEHTSDEKRWRVFLRNLHKALVADQADNLLAPPGEWKTPTSLSGNQITMFELLQHPDLKSIFPEVKRLRKIARQMYQAFNDPDTFNQPPETTEMLTAKLTALLPSAHRKILGHSAIRSNSETGRWQHRHEGYQGTFSQEMISVKGRLGADILTITFKPNSTEFTHRMNPEKMIQFAQLLGLI